MSVVTAFDVLLDEFAFSVKGLILNVSGVDGDAALSLFRSLVDGRIVGVISAADHGQVLGDGRGQGGLAVVDVADGADIDMGLGSIEFLLCH
jgi:hypothetical protein